MDSTKLIEMLRRKHLGIYGKHVYGTDSPRWRYPAPWVFFEELRMGTGYAQRRYWFDLESGKHRREPAMIEGRLDAWAMMVTNATPGNGHAITYEVKISRSDFNNESDLKRAPGLAVSNEFYYVTPKGLLTAEDIPDECGLIEAWGRSLRTIVKAPVRERDALPERFVMSLARRGSEEEHRRWVEDVYEPRRFLVE